MKLKFSKIIEVEPNGIDEFVVTVGDGYFYQGHEVIIKEDLKHFDAADCEAQDLLCPPLN